MGFLQLWRQCGVSHEVRRGVQVASRVATGISGLHSRLTRGKASSRGETKYSALLSSRDRYLLEPIEWPKGSKASCEVWRKDQGLLSRSGRKRSPQSRDDGGFSRAAAPVWGFSRGMTGSSGSLSCGAREVRCPCAWRGGACHCSRVMVGESVLKTR